HEAHLAIELAQQTLQLRVRGAAVRALEIAEFQDGDLGHRGAARRRVVDWDVEALFCAEARAVVFAHGRPVVAFSHESGQIPRRGDARSTLALLLRATGDADRLAAGREL